MRLSRFPVASVILVCLSLAAPCNAETDGVAVFNTLKKLLPGGTWSTTSTDGEQLEHTYSSAGGGKFLRNEMKGGPLAGTALVGVDRESGRCVWRTYREDGTIVSMTLTEAKPNVWRLESVPGSPIQYKGEITLVDDNTVREEVVELLIDGEKQAGVSTWTRHYAPPAVEEWLRYMVGTWEFSMNDGRSGKGTWRSAGSTPAVIFFGEANEDFSILGVIGWRADQNMVVETDFHTQSKGVNGNLNRQYSTITREVMKGTGRFWETAGEVGSHPIEYRRINDDEMTLSGGESNDGGKAWEVMFKRVK